MKKHIFLIILFLVGLILSAINPHDYFTWILEVFPAVIGFFVILFTFKNFQFSQLTYGLILVHCYILFIGGHYTYAEVPLFDWLRDVFHQNRNNYDKLGHFTQGFVPAIITRELLVRKEIVKQRSWLSFLTVCVCLSISAFYEFLEWFIALFSGQDSDSFLGTQGYVWDTQSDMLYATIGAISMVLLFSKIQDKHITKLV
jgi:putative membrane protein